MPRGHKNVVVFPSKGRYTSFDWKSLKRDILNLISRNPMIVAWEIIRHREMKGVSLWDIGWCIDSLFYDERKIRWNVESDEEGTPIKAGYVIREGS